MELDFSKLLNQKEPLIFALSKKFHISYDGAKEFLKLAIIERVKTHYTIQISGNFLKGNPEILHKLEQDILLWTEDDFDEEDFQIIGYCKNIQ